VGFFDFVSDVGSAIGSALNPIGATVNVVAKEISTKADARERLENENMAYIDPYSSGTGSYGLPTIAGQTTSPGFFSEGGALRSGLRDFGGFLGDFAPVAGVFGLGDRFQNVPSAGAETIIRQRPDESSMSGELLGANLGMGGALVSAGRQLFRSPGGQTALGFGAGALGAALSGGGDGKVRITRRMKSDVRKIYMMAGMDPNATAQILNNLGTYPRMRFDASLVFFILTKRFRNDGPVVTKAAVRKTKTTLRRMKGVVDMYNSVCKTPTRRAPARRAAPKAVQLIKN
jgi:hypothetical protein